MNPMYEPIDRLVGYNYYIRFSPLSSHLHPWPDPRFERQRVSITRNSVITNGLFRNHHFSLGFNEQRRSDSPEKICLKIIRRFQPELTCNKQLTMFR